jgi:uncharacterized protein
MRDTPQGTGFSATDLAAFLECEHRTVLDLGVLSGKFERPGQNEIERRLLELRGVEHERNVLERYRRSGRQITNIPMRPGLEGQSRSAAETLDAMSAGADVIYQGVIAHENWAGRADFLIKVPGGGRFAHHYEVVDAKLAREAKASAVLQLCVYTDHLSRLQERVPKYFHIAGGGDAEAPTPLLVDDYMAYYRAIRQRFERFVAQGDAVPYPEPVDHCNVCLWWKRCEERRRADDHLSLVAGSTRRQRDKLATARVSQLRQLAELRPGSTIEGIARDSLGRLAHQARLQLTGRTTGKPVYELLRDVSRGVGLEALPVPTPGDLFLDLEGDSFVKGRGLDYLFGLLELGELDFSSTREAPGEPRYHAFWASDAASEKLAFEKVIDRIERGREEFQNLHVFHFGHRESDALKKLSCRHKTREAAVDRLLRDHVLVDLHPIVRHSLRGSVESYTLKQLESFHDFTRSGDLRAAARAMQLFGWWLETADPAVDPSELRGDIEVYNRDDCLSTRRLRDWLEARREELEKATGTTLTRPVVEAATLNEERSKANQETAELASALVEGLPADPVPGTPEHARRLMADLLEWHWREAKSGFWEFYRARDLAPADRLEDRSVLAELVYEGQGEPIKRSEVHRYRFPEQEHGVRLRPSPIDPDTEKNVNVFKIDAEHLLVKRVKGSSAPHPTALVPGKPIATKSQEESLFALGKAIARDPSGSDFGAARALLSAAVPRAGQAPGSALVAPGESVERALGRLALGLDRSILPVQGPPGSGKTHQAALMILALVRAGKRVGVTANSHAVIKNVLGKVAELAGEAQVRALHIEDDDSDEANGYPFELDANKERVLKRLAARELDVVGGTSWVWSTERFAESVDVLIVDEAGQMSLANVLAVARAAQSLVLFGDPAQLEQPQKGVHPPGAEVSALEHLLGGEALTIPPDRGVFLPLTRRLHPKICEFISKIFYEDRLQPDLSLGLERQLVSGPGVFAGAGLRYVPVAHRGNTNESDEEVAVIRRLIDELFATSPTFTDREGETRPLSERDVLVVSPYNAQVAAITRALPKFKVGTVDKFQGQEAPIVIYSMATSTAEDAPRGLEFLYSLNRLNVAVSRAQAVSVLVASPELARAACKTPRQMKLVNGLCAYLELATEYR